MSAMYQRLSNHSLPSVMSFFQLKGVPRKNWLSCLQQQLNHTSASLWDNSGTLVCGRSVLCILLFCYMERKKKWVCRVEILKIIFAASSRTLSKTDFFFLFFFLNLKCEDVKDTMTNRQFGPSALISAKLLKVLPRLLL